MEALEANARACVMCGAGTGSGPTANGDGHPARAINTFELQEDLKAENLFLKTDGGYKLTPTGTKQAETLAKNAKS
jgi:hypothetical protein